MSFINKLRFVKKQLENDDVYTFYFETPKGMPHKAGQHGIFVIPGLYRPHPFTMSSSPEEEFITVSTHTGTGSRFKRNWLDMKPGDTVWFFGPIMNFTFQRGATKHVFLAQGIGITPFRSMLVHAHNVNLPDQTTLIHVDSKGHAFKDLTAQYATKSYYPASADEFRRIVLEQGPDGMFYLSGSGKFLSATKKLLAELGVPKKNIKNDWFFGY